MNSDGSISDEPVSGIGVSGYLYDSNGVHKPTVGSVPEPSIWTLMVVGLALSV